MKGKKYQKKIEVNKFSIFYLLQSKLNFDTLVTTGNINATNNLI